MAYTRRSELRSDFSAADAAALPTHNACGSISPPSFLSLPYFTLPDTHADGTAPSGQPTAIRA